MSVFSFVPMSQVSCAGPAHGVMLVNFSFLASVVADVQPDAQQAEHWAQQVASTATELSLKG